jgi:hypothetical protein
MRSLCCTIASWTGRKAYLGYNRVGEKREQNKNKNGSKAIFDEALPPGAEPSGSRLWEPNRKEPRAGEVFGAGQARFCSASRA